MTEAEIEQAATRIYRAFDSIEWVEPPCLQNFPEECCQWASVVAGLLFHQADKNLNVELFRGECPLRRDAGHYWLVVDGVIVDLTAGQFPDQPAIHLGRDNRWHEGLVGKLIFKIDSKSIEDRRLVHAFGETYQRLCEALDVYPTFGS